MASCNKCCTFIVHRSTLALMGAFMIHITLGTVYTLSNVNSYMTSYMRLHGTPNATYGGSMWLSSSYAIGQGLFMILGGYVENRFSARLACMLGCLLHSLSIMSTAFSINHGQLAVLLTYGLLPGFGAGLAYMTPMSNGFGWFPDRKGLVAGIILGGFGLGAFVFNIAQTTFVNPDNLSPPSGSGGYFIQASILERVPKMFFVMGAAYASLQLLGCCLMFSPPQCSNESSEQNSGQQLCMATEAEDIERVSDHSKEAIPLDKKPLRRAVKSRQFIALFIVYGVTNQGVLFVNSMLKEYAQLFISDDLFLAWTGSAASVANSLGRFLWGLAIDRFTFTQCFTASTLIFGTLMFVMPFKPILSSKLFYLLCTLGIFGSFSCWKSTYPVHLARVFGPQNSGMIYGLIYASQTIGSCVTAFGARFLIDNFSRFVPFFVATFLEVLGLAVYHLFYFK